MFFSSEIFSIIGGITLVLSLVYLGYSLLRLGKKQNRVYWAILVSVDTLALLSAIFAKNDNPYLQASYLLGDIIISLILFRTAEWKWTIVEKFAATSAGTAIVVSALGFFLWDNPSVGLIASIAAVYLAGIAPLFDGLEKPQDIDLKFWGSLCVGSFLCFLGADKLILSEYLQPLIASIFTFIMCLIAFKKNKNGNFKYRV